jgi:hypothetical protein
MPKMVNLFQSRHLDWIAEHIPNVLREVDFTPEEVEKVGEVLLESLQHTNGKFSRYKFMQAWNKAPVEVAEVQPLPANATDIITEAFDATILASTGSIAYEEWKQEYGEQLGVITSIEANDDAPF